ncbi:outer membrane protein assembly factor BamE [Primorskyibacter sp. S187A]|uniref:outer membrane protein assembly factor BamE n=1 Tax=Primorskyibacter sp. S187A TaxID=3415130 RepID=UPI003C7BC6C9
MLATAGCTESIRNHGYLPGEEDLANVVVGLDTRDTVAETLGPPTTAGILSGGNFYYVGDKVRSYAWQAPKIIEREIVAVTFDQAGVVENVTRYGLEDGRVVPIVRRVTETSDGDISFIRKLFGNIGGLSTDGLLGNN